jgi:hypothetical protein
LAALRAVGVAGVIGGMGLVGAFGGAIYAIQTTSVANAVFLFAAAPLITALLARAVLGERVRPETWGAIALALVGSSSWCGRACRAARSRATSPGSTSAPASPSSPCRCAGARSRTRCPRC